MTDQDGKAACGDAMKLLSTAEKLIEFSAGKNEERSNRLAEDDESYNIFDVLNLTTNEVNGHSRFLHHLLSPRGSHGMGDVFLKAFFKQILEIDPEPWISEARVGREVVFEDGRLDILIDCPNSCCVVIEVKIYADDQFRQLERYSDYIKQWEQSNPDASVILEVYLTLDGRKASDYSVGKSDTKYESLSFTELVPWLESCISLSSQRPRIADTIKQYLELVNKVTGRMPMDSELECITEMVGESKTSYEASVQIENSLSHVRMKLLQKMFDDIEKYLESELSANSNLTTDAERADIEKYYIRGERRRPYPRLKFKIKENEDRVLALVVELWDSLWIGTVFFKKAENEWGFERIDNEREWLYSLSLSPVSKKWKTIVDNAPANDWWLDWRFKDTSPTDEGLIDFRFCSSAEDSQFDYADLFDRQKYEKFIELVYRGIDEYLNRLKELGVLQD